MAFVSVYRRFRSICKQVRLLVLHQQAGPVEASPTPLRPAVRIQLPPRDPDRVERSDKVHEALVSMGAHSSLHESRRVHEPADVLKARLARGGLGAVDVSWRSEPSLDVVRARIKHGPSKPPVCTSGEVAKPERQRTVRHIEQRTDGHTHGQVVDPTLKRPLLPGEKNAGPLRAADRQAWH